MTPAVTERELSTTVESVVNQTPILDIHTHLYHPRFGPLLLWGVDELLTYHYLIAEVLRAAPMPYETFWAMNKPKQADFIWQHLFMDRSPISEACRGVVTVLHALGLEPRQSNLESIRSWFKNQAVEAYIEKVFSLANISGAIMTNDPFDDVERPCWEKGTSTDNRFQTALRIDPLLNDWEKASKRLNGWGYAVNGSLEQRDIESVRRFLVDWIERIQPRYMAVSLPPTFAFPEESSRARLIEYCILPVAREAKIPFAMMIGVKRSVNPQLRLAGDGVRASNLDAVDALCRDFPENRFLITTLSREDQHTLCVTARKQPNLHVFGCWWFLNNPSLIEEMTRQRFELLGLSITPQHSDARVLDQVIYKWTHWRRILSKVLTDKYRDLLSAGWPITIEDIRRDVVALGGGTFNRFCGA